jgi:ketosteroid isomerase-like protein
MPGPDFEALDPRMDTAMAKQDASALEELLAPDFLYTHSNGMTPDKRAFIDGIMARTNPPRRDLTEVQGEVHGDVAVSRGNLDVVYDDGRRLVFRYVRVYRLDDGHWQPISHRTLYAKDRESQD